MTNAELAATLNDEFDLADARAITVNVIRQWVLWDLLPAATPTGRVIGKSPGWSRDDCSMRRARRLATLRIAGLTGQHELIAQAYFEWGHPDFGLVREALAKEFRKARRQMMKGVSSNTEFASVDTLSAVNRKALRHQAGPLDSRFAGSMYELTPKASVVSLAIIKSGSINTDSLNEILKAWTDSVFSGIDTDTFTGPIKFFINGINGLFGDENEIENSGLFVIERASKTEFRVARIILKRCLKALTRTIPPDLPPEINDPLRKLAELNSSIADQVSVGKWAICAMALILKAIHDHR